MKQVNGKTNRALLSPRLSVIAALVATTFHPAHAATDNWISNVGGYWDVATNWGLGVPTAADDAVMNTPGSNGLVVRSTGGPYTVNSVTLTGNNSLAVGSGSLTVNSTFASYATSVSSGGSLIVNGSFTQAPSTWTTVSAGGNLILNGTSSSAQLLQDGTVGGTGVYTITGQAQVGEPYTVPALQKDAGTTVLQSTSTIFWLNVDTGRTINNAATGTVTISGGAGLSGWILDLDSGSGVGGGTFQNDGVFITSQTGGANIYNTYGSGVFNNAGTFVKKYDGSGYSSDTNVYTAFNNSGAVDVQTGRMRLYGGGTSTGSFAVASGAELTFGGSGGTTLSQAPTGLGTTVIDSYGGSVTANGGINTSALTLSMGTLNLGRDSTVATFKQTSGALVGAGLTVTGTAYFSNDAPQQGAAITRLEGNTGMGSLRLDTGRTLQNAATGTVTWTGNPNFAVSIIDLDYTNAAGNGTIQNDGLFVAADNYATSIVSTNGGGEFNNAGTFRKQGSSTTTVNVPFNNTGLVDVQSGILSLNSSGNTYGGVFTVANGGTLAFAGGGTHNLPSSLTGLGTTKVGNATVVNANNGIGTSGLVIDGGTLNLGVASSVSNYSQTNGTLDGTSALTVTGASSFNGDSTVHTPFSNLGAMSVQTGTLSLTSPNFTNDGSINTAKGATIITSTGGLTNNGTLTVSGTYAGDLTQTTTGKMLFQLGSRTNYDTLSVLGNLTLDGSLEIQSVGGFNPWNGDTFTILGVPDVNNLTGIFSSISWSGFDPSTQFHVNYLDHSVALTVTSAVPVPSSVWLLGTGLVALTSAARRRKS